MGDKWTLLIIRDLAAGPRRFVELQRVLPGISTEQLRSRLNRMVADGLLTRQRYREVPPRVDYELTERSRELMPVVGALARWGYDWTWTAPRPGEDVNVGAIFRLAPGMIEPPRGVEGTVELIVESNGDEQPERHYRLIASRGRVEISEADSDAAAVRRRPRQPGRLGARARARAARRTSWPSTATAASPTRSWPASPPPPPAAPPPDVECAEALEGASGFAGRTESTSVMQRCR